jgi:hypothetical protein
MVARWQRTIVDGAGNVLPGATITVRREETGAPLASLFSDRDGTVPIANPFDADGDGFAFFFAEGGPLRIDVVSGGFSQTLRYVALGTAAEFDASDFATPANLPGTADEDEEGLVDQATDGEIRAATSGAHGIMAEDLETAAELVALTDAATVTLDWTAGINFTLTITTDRVLGNPSSGIPGQTRTVFVISDGGPDELTFGNQYGGERPTLDDITTTKGYLLSIYCRTASQFLVTAIDGSPA